MGPKPVCGWKQNATAVGLVALRPKRSKIQLGEAGRGGGVRRRALHSRVPAIKAASRIPRRWVGQEGGVGMVILGGQRGRPAKRPRSAQICTRVLVRGPRLGALLRPCSGPAASFWTGRHTTA